MAWTAPRTWTTGEVVTASHMNTHVRDNMLTVTPAGAVSAYAGLTAPSGWLLCNGASVSRTTYSVLFAAVTFTVGSGSTNGTTTVTVSSTADLAPGMGIEGTNIPAGATISSITNGTQFVISSSATGTTSGLTFTFLPYGRADTSNFNVPDMRGRLAAGVNSAGVAATHELRGLGVNDGVTAASRNVAHSHTGSMSTRSTTGSAGTIAGSISHVDVANQTTTGITVGDTSNPDHPAYTALNWIIKI